MTDPTPNQIVQARHLAGFFAKRFRIQHLIADVAASALETWSRTFDAARGSASMWLTWCVRRAAWAMAQTDHRLRRLREEVLRDCSPTSRHSMPFEDDADGSLFSPVGCPAWHPPTPDEHLLDGELRALLRGLAGDDVALFELQRPESKAIAGQRSAAKGTGIKTEQVNLSRRKERLVFLGRHLVHLYENGALGPGQIRRLNAAARGQRKQSAGIHQAVRRSIVDGSMVVAALRRPRGFIELEVMSALALVMGMVVGAVAVCAVVSHVLCERDMALEAAAAAEQRADDLAVRLGALIVAGDNLQRAIDVHLAIDDDDACSCWRPEAL